MKKIYLGLILLLLVTLTGCSLFSNPNFHEIEGLEIDGYQVYEYFDENAQEDCEPSLVQWQIAARTDDEVLVTRFPFMSCAYSFLVLRNNTFISLTEAIEFDLFTIEDVKNASSNYFIETYDLKEKGIAYFTIEKPNEQIRYYDDVTDVQRIIATSSNFLQRFVKFQDSHIDIFDFTTQLGTIKAYDSSDQLVSEMVVYEDLIHDITNGGYMHSESFELYYELTLN